MYSRLDQEEFELRNLSKYATLSKNAKRSKFEEQDLLRTAYQRDRDRIIHSKSFRRLKHKTQVYISPEVNPYIGSCTDC